MDLVYLAGIVAFVVLTIALAYGCARLERRK
jgi:hypothetical protein